MVVSGRQKPPISREAAFGEKCAEAKTDAGKEKAPGGRFGGRDGSAAGQRRGRDGRREEEVERACWSDMTGAEREHEEH